MSVSKRHLKNKKVLITCGPTWVPIDTMRVIGNRSTGELGQQIAQEFAQAGAKVTLLQGPVIDPLVSGKIKVRTFAYYKDFAALLKKELRKKVDIVVHAAAVSDYRMSKPFKAKLNSGRKKVLLTLVPTPKLINSIKRLAPKCCLIGFKLESATSQKAIMTKAVKLLNDAKCDLVIGNTLNGGYKAYIVNDKKQIIARASSRAGLAKTLARILKG